VNTIRHIAIRTEDTERLATFYKEVFGMKELQRSSRAGGSLFLTDGYFNVALLENGEQNSRNGLYHFGFQVDSQAEIEHKIQEVGLSRPPMPRPSNRPYAETRASDPDGNYFDISERGFQVAQGTPRGQETDQPSEPARNTIRHLAIKTENGDKLIRFYRDVFGMHQLGQRNAGIQKEGIGTVIPRGGYMSDGYFNLAILSNRDQQAPNGLYHFGFKVESQEEIFERIRDLSISRMPKRRPDGRPYAETRASDPDGNYFDISEHGFQEEERAGEIERIGKLFQ
jgi:catechol-2,3-dioxygenase